MQVMRLGVLLWLMATLAFAGCEHRSSDWVQYHSDSDGNVYLYDQTKIKKDTAKNTVDVWAKQIYSDAGRVIELQSRIKEGLSVAGYEELTHKICRYEIDCGKKGIKILSISHFDKNGKSLYFGVDQGEKKMFDITPDSTSGALFNEVCTK